MAKLKTGWMKKLIDGVSEKIFAIAHVKTVYYDYRNKTTLSDKLDEIDKRIDESVTKDTITDALGYTPYTPNEIDNKFSTLETNIDWKEAVATFSDIATTYPNPEDGWTVNVKDTDYTYRYNGTDWVAISANAIPKATSSVDGLMSSSDKGKLDGIAVGANKYVHPSYTAKSSVLWKIVVDAAGHVSDTTAVTKSDITNLGIPGSDTKNTAGSTDTSSKIFLIGATSQAANPQTYSQDTAYVGTDGCLYSGGKKTSVEGHTHSYAGSSSAGGAANSLSYFQNTSNTSIGQDTCNSNAIGYVGDYSGPALSSNVKDGALYRQAYSTSWVHEIYGDYRTGQIAVRGKNNGTWQSWKCILDESNYASYAVTKSGNSTVSGAITFGNNDSYGIRTSADNYGRIGESGKAFYQSHIYNMYGTLQGSIGVSTLFTQQFTFSVSAIAGGSDSAQALKFTTPTGCTALGIVGKFMNGNYYTYLVFTSEYVSGNSIQTMIHNSGSTTTGTINITYIILFCKRS